ncbi:hypothetical protein QJS83_02550 [Bdellovibrio sp. 22V]|uniref:hypothetical protein n=1 Tax=Bdellovibrio sp. 22V TaxID=3044166 RepID=UPI002543ADAA|nr:hypothetical protein [Bdellovibrio sp. 22V]WII72749.1 hypothetical protein QJS83_02550 [Bdellovibrio sp. 22V]
MGKFRISFGGASCVECRARSAEETSLCEVVLMRLEHIKALSFEQLKNFPEEEYENFDIKGIQTALTIHRCDLDEQSILIVVQVFLPTWKFPTYFSVNGVGKMFADGIIVNKNGQKSDAPDEYLFQYR